MATQIEILFADATVASLALYYAIPAGSQLAAAVDPERAPAGIRLAAQELQDLKDGRIHELLRTVPINGMTQVAARARVEATWAENQATATAEYNARYRFSHIAWDGVTWS